MRNACLAFLVSMVFTAVDALAQGHSGMSSSGRQMVALDFDPLRRYLPRSDIFQQVPGAKAAIENFGASEGISIEEQTFRRNGGLVVGYCLKASCSHVTHLVVLQVCNGYIGGPDGTNELVLGVVRLPFGKTPGYIKSLQGRNYARNFAVFGPVEQTLHDTTGDTIHSNYSLWAQGTGAVEALEYVGEDVRPEQSTDTIAVQMINVRDRDSGVRAPRVDVRHLCRPSLS